MTKLATNQASAPSTATSTLLQEMFVLEHPENNCPTKVAKQSRREGRKKRGYLEWEVVV
jgi:hypothetical protein